MILTSFINRKIIILINCHHRCPGTSLQSPSTPEQKVLKAKNIFVCFHQVNNIGKEFKRFLYNYQFVRQCPNRAKFVQRNYRLKAKSSDFPQFQAQRPKQRFLTSNQILLILILKGAMFQTFRIRESEPKAQKNTSMKTIYQPNFLATGRSLMSKTLFLPNSFKEICNLLVKLLAEIYWTLLQSTLIKRMMLWLQPSLI